MKGDVIRELNRKKIKNPDRVQCRDDKQQQDRPLPLLILRSGNTIFIAINK